MRTLLTPFIGHELVLPCPAPRFTFDATWLRHATCSHRRGTDDTQMSPTRMIAARQPNPPSQALGPQDKLCLLNSLSAWLRAKARTLVSARSWDQRLAIYTRGIPSINLSALRYAIADYNKLEKNNQVMTGIRQVRIISIHRYKIHCTFDFVPFFCIFRKMNSNAISHFRISHIKWAGVGISRLTAAVTRRCNAGAGHADLSAPSMHGLSSTFPRLSKSAREPGDGTTNPNMKLFKTQKVSSVPIQHFLPGTAWGRWWIGTIESSPHWITLNNVYIFWCFFNFRVCLFQLPGARKLPTLVTKAFELGSILVTAAGVRKAQMETKV